MQKAETVPHCKKQDEPQEPQNNGQRFKLISQVVEAVPENSNEWKKQKRHIGGALGIIEKYDKT